MNISTASANGISCKYFRFGKSGAQPFVILPGVAAKSVMYSADLIAAQYSAPAEIYDIYVIDRREDMPSEYSVYEMAEDTAQIMYALGLENAVVYGVSQGGMMAQLIAAKHPGLVDKLVLCSTASYIPDTAAAVLNRWTDLARDNITELMLSFAENIYTESYCRTYRDTFAEFAKALTDEDIRRFLITVKGTPGFDARVDIRSIKCPVLVMAGAMDRIFDPSLSEETAALTGGISHIFPGQAHGVYDENAEVIDMIMTFCNGTE